MFYFNKRSLHILFAFLLICLISFHGNSQGIVKGKVTDENGESLIGLTIFDKSNPSAGTITDFDGNYSFKFGQGGKKILVFSYTGYLKFEQEIDIILNQVVIKDIVMISASEELAEVEIVAKQEKARVYYMENLKKKSATTIDYVSSQTMKLTGDNNATAAIARVSGVSTNGGFITVRGIGDRYVNTNLNGAQIPTLDPFTNNIKLDIFPSSLIDNIIITKTSSPELPGSWSGAYISVETKDFPDKLLVNIENSISYNQQASFKDVLDNGKSKTDWLGFDSNFRDRDQSNFHSANPFPSTFDQFIALGLGPYFKSLGVTNPWIEGTTAGENYFKLGLVELGLLPKSQFEDPNAFEIAKNKFITEGFEDKAFVILNEKASISGQSLPNNWNLQKKKAPISFSSTYTFGNQSKLFGIDLGYIVALRYNSSVQFDPNAHFARSASLTKDSLGNPLFESSTNIESARYSNGWSALSNLSLKLNQNNNLTFLFMPNFIGTNNLRNGVGLGDFVYKYTININQYYEQRRQLLYQFRSEHFLPFIKSKIGTNISYTDGKSKAPDFKNLELFAGPEFIYNYDKTKSYISRDFRYLDESILDTKFNIEIPLFEKPGYSRKLKFGSSFQQFKRIYNQYNYSLNFNNVSNVITNNDIDAYFSLERFGIGWSRFGGYQHKSIDFYYGRPDEPSNHAFGRNNVLASYLLVDYALFSRLRISTGIRAERTDLLTDAISYHELDLPYNHKGRRGITQSFIVNAGILKSWDILPSANLIFKLKKDEKSPINLRLNYSKTLARPSLREFSETIVYDYELDAQVIGNALLKMVKIDNYDIRLESYFKSGDNISLSLFYKKFANHIELIQGFTWTNALSSNVLGVELDGKKKIWKGLELSANISLVNSKSEIVANDLTILNFVRKWNPIDTFTRQMFGQAPYVLNGILSYTFEKIGAVFAVSYNQQGPRLVFTSLDVYEMPRHLIDVKASKSLGKYFTISLSVRDVLNSPIRRSYKFDNSKYLLDFDKYTYGTNYSLGFTYKI